MLHNSAISSSISYSLEGWLIISTFHYNFYGILLSNVKNQNLFDVMEFSHSMVNFEKVYQRVAMQVIARCHGAIKITKHGKIIEVYDTKRHIWSNGLAGLIIKEECRNENLKEWEFANVRSYVIQKLLGKSEN